MNRVAALPAGSRNELFSLTAERMGMGSVAVVEKDFWVCWVLKQIFADGVLSKLLVFKGGTSLAKVFGLIDRFSEDIDLILDWRVVEGEDPMAERTNTRQRKLNEEINQKAVGYIAETLVPRLEGVLGIHCEVLVKTGEKDQGHIVQIQYPTTAEAGNLLPHIELEVGPLASWLPNSNYIVRPYAWEEFPGQFDDAECPVRAIDAQRTFWEKATILHHEANRPEGSPVPLRYSRHYYDLYMMAKDRDVKQSAMEDLGMLRDVVAFKKKFYPRGWANYGEAKPGSLKLLPPEHERPALFGDYDAMQDMIFGRNPSFKEILDGLETLEAEINGLEKGGGHPS